MIRLLSEANRKAKQQIRNGTIVLFSALLGAGILGILAVRWGSKAQQAQKNIERANLENLKFKSAKQQFEIKVKSAKQQAQIAKNQAQQATLEAKSAQKQAQIEKNKAQIAKNQAQQANLEVKSAKEQAQKNAQIAKNQAQKAQEIAERAKLEFNSAKKQAEIQKKNALFAKDEAQKAQKIAQQENLKARLIKNQSKWAKEELLTLTDLSQLAGELQNRNLISESNEVLRQVGLSFRVEDYNLKQAMLLASISQAYQNLKKPDLAQDSIIQSLEYLNIEKNNIISEKGLQIKLLIKLTKGNLAANNNPKQAIKYYQEAYNILKQYPSQTNPFRKNQIITIQDVELVYRELLYFIPNQDLSNLKQQVWDSLKEHLFIELEYFLKAQDWQKADEKTWKLMLLIANTRKKTGSIPILQKDRKKHTLFARISRE